ncbi:MAG: apiosidase-like domain-containing protein [Planctomycetota bacterium]
MTRNVALKSKTSFTASLGATALLLVTCAAASAETHHVWEKVEITLKAKNSYENPYTEVEVWVDLKGPGFDKQCYGFWDGGKTFRVRVLAATPGSWTWRSGSNQRDSGLNGKTGKFTAASWSDAEVEKNPCRRGMIKASSNGHAFEYADGTPFFLLGDTWWATPTFRYRWHDDDRQRPIGPAAGFKNYVRFRTNQGFNCFAMIVAFPNWANDGRSNRLKANDGTILRAAWQQPGTKSAKDMHDEDGNRAFLFPGKVPGFENTFPDVDRINPAYFQNLDKKIDYLNASGVVPFMEVSRRDIGYGWKKFYDWPDSYVRYIQYVWSRYQANICLFSPIHFDTSGATIPAEEWNKAANKVVEKYGPPPFGTPAGTNSNPSSLRNFGHTDKAKWLTFHQIGNRRTHNYYQLLTEIFNTSPPVPGINGEPYYAGMHDAPGGSANSALYCRSGMYGSVLSGGLGGHIYGAGGWDGGLWGGNVEDAAENHIWDAMKWPSGDQMRHMAAFVLSEGPKYQQLVPSRQLLKPNESGEPEGYTGWAYCSRTAEKDLFLLYFEKDCPKATLSGAQADGIYSARWFNPRKGDWSGIGVLTADSSGKIAIPAFPDNSDISKNDWAMKLTLSPAR